MLVGSGVCDANAERPRGLPPWRCMSLLLLRVGDIVRESQSISRSSFPSDAALCLWRWRERILWERRCRLTPSKHSASSSPGARPQGSARCLAQDNTYHSRSEKSTLHGARWPSIYSARADSITPTRAGPSRCFTRSPGRRRAADVHFCALMLRVQTSACVASAPSRSTRCAVRMCSA